jgi:trigger factor
MQVTLQRISPVVLELQVEVPADRVRTEVDKAYLTLGKKAHIRGFRPGKAPRSVLSHIYGDKISNDVASQIVNDTLPQVLTEKNVTPVTRPTVEAGKFAINEAFSYKARFEVHPDIENVTYEGFELFRPKLEATPEMVDEQIEALRHRHSTLKTPEPARPSQKGDVLTIDFTISVEGKDVKDAGGQGVQIEIGAGQALPELDAALLGKNAGDVVTVESTFAAQHQHPELRGKKGEFKVTVTEVKERILPALDDEFAKDVGQFQTLIELRADVHSRLEQANKDRQQTALAEQIITKLNERNPIEVPPSLVEQQCRLMETEFQAQARRMGQKITQDQAQSMHDKIHAEAEKKVRAGLLMAAIARKGDFKVSDEDIEKGLGELAEQSGKNIAKVKAEYRDAQKRQMLIGLILEDKILDLVEAKAKITEGDPASQEAGEGAKAGEETGTEAPASRPRKDTTPAVPASKKKAKKAEP